MPDDPEREPGDPQAQPQTERRRDGAVDDRDRARRTRQKDRLGERAMQRHLEAFDMGAHDTNAPPPKEKKVRKKLDAAKAMEMPKTIWMRRRKPPAVSPKASVRPVVMMMITAMILATGPWTESKICWSGCSHGMPAPAA